MTKDVNLTPPFPSMVGQKRLNGQWPLLELLGLLNSLRDFDLQIEQKEKRFLGLSIAFFVVAFLCLIFVFASPVVFLPILIISLGAGIVFIIFKRHYHRMDLRNEFRQFLKPMLEVLSEDVQPDAPVSLDVQLGSLQDPKFLARTSLPYKAEPYYKCIDYHYEREFLSIRLPLLDGNRLHLKGQEYLIKSEKTKRNPRGKIKTKNKFKKLVTLTICLYLNEARFEFKVPQEASGRSDVNISRKKKWTVVKMVHTMKIKGVEDPVPSPQEVLEKLIFLYASVQRRQLA